MSALDHLSRGWAIAQVDPAIAVPRVLWNAVSRWGTPDIVGTRMWDTTCEAIGAPSADYWAASSDKPLEFLVPRQRSCWWRELPPG